MQSRRFAAILVTGLLGCAVAACAAPAAPASSTAAPASAPSAALASAAQSTAIPDATAEVVDTTTSEAFNQSITGVIAEGEIAPQQDASLLFGVSGTVKQVLVHEGDTVATDQVLAMLDTQSLDLQVAQAEASLAGVKAQLANLSEAPRTASVTSAQAQLSSAQAALAELKAGPKVEDVASARASLEAAKANLQSQRDSLAAAKVRADSALTQAANSLRDAQDSYSQIYWKNRELEKLPGDLSQSSKDEETAAQRAVASAEESMHQAQVSLENARQAEQTGVQSAEQQVAQQQAALDKVLRPATADEIAAAEAQVAQAKSSLDSLLHPSTNAQIAQQKASVDQAQASLESAQYNRSQAELHAPFAGVVAEVNIDVGDPSSSSSSSAAIRLLDVSMLYAEVDVSDVDIASVAVGQPVQLRVESLPATEFSGKVAYIAPTATVSSNVRSYLVRVSIDDQAGLLAGMRVRATIERMTAR